MSYSKTRCVSLIYPPIEFDLHTFLRHLRDTHGSVKHTHTGVCGCLSRGHTQRYVSLRYTVCLTQEYCVSQIDIRSVSFRNTMCLTHTHPPIEFELHTFLRHSRETHRGVTHTPRCVSLKYTVCFTRKYGVSHPYISVYLSTYMELHTKRCPKSPTSPQKSPVPPQKSPTSDTVCPPIYIRVLIDV